MPQGMVHQTVPSNATGNKLAQIRMGKLGIGGFLLDAGINTAMNKGSGMNLRDAAVKGLGQSVMWNLVGAYSGVMAAYGVGMAAGALYDAGRAKWHGLVAQNYSSGILGGRYIDTRQALTMRQAAVQAIDQSRINGRQVLGNEASFMHR